MDDDDDDGTWWKKTLKMWGKTVFKVARDHLGTLAGAPIAKKIKSERSCDFFLPSFCVIQRYAYQSTRTDLIKLFLWVLIRFDEKKHKFYKKLVLVFQGGSASFVGCAWVCELCRARRAWKGPPLEMCQDLAPSVICRGGTSGNAAWKILLSA